MRKIRSQEKERYETPDDLSIPDFLRRPFIPATVALLPCQPAEPKIRLPRSGFYNPA
jgi:hypothetical protein